VLLLRPDVRVPSSADWHIALRCGSNALRVQPLKMLLPRGGRLRRFALALATSWPSYRGGSYSPLPKDNCAWLPRSTAERKLGTHFRLGADPSQSPEKRQGSMESELSLACSRSLSAGEKEA
jgi:hypothetical protein